MLPKTALIVIAMTVGFFSGVSSELWSQATLILCSLFGAILGAGYNYDFIKNNKIQGGVIAVGSLLFPILFTQAVMYLTGFEEFRVGNLIGLLSGFISFGVVMFLLENQNPLAKRVINLGFKKAGEKENTDGDS